MTFKRKLREFLGLSQSKLVVDIPPRPDRDGVYWYKEMLRKVKKKKSDHLLCPWPDCEGSLCEGPSGGLSMNVKCDECERRWNYTPAIQHLDRL
ncbi:hypothetical protein AMJ86_04780 [bacterium SM23_57]|nr:MAG: hypothetical protein AMJ86_04780 [bacterium SM23_57]